MHATLEPAQYQKHHVIKSDRRFYINFVIYAGDGMAAIILTIEIRSTQSAETHL